MIVTALIRLAEPQFSSAATAGEKVPPQRGKLVGAVARKEARTQADLLEF